MNEDVFNMSVRKFLKKVGVTSQREIEKAVRQEMDAGNVAGKGPLAANVVLSVPEIGLTVEINGELELD
jgi:hypothetical protein